MQKAVFGALYQTGAWQQLEALIRGGKTPCSAFGLVDNRKNHLLAGLFNRLNRPLLVVTPTDIRAMRLAEELSNLTGTEVPVFPARHLNLRKRAAASRDTELRRLEVMARLTEDKAPIIVAAADALMMPLVPFDVFNDAVIKIKENDEIKQKQLISRLYMAGYVREERAEGIGQFALRGGILDVFPTGSPMPVRIEFFGDTVDMIRHYDPSTQRSAQRLSEINIWPANEIPLNDEALERGAKAMRQSLTATQGVLRHMEKQNVPEGKYIAQDDPAERLTAMVNDAVDALVMHGSFESMENHITAFYKDTCLLSDYMERPLVVLEEPARIAEMMKNAANEYQAEYKTSLANGDALDYQKTMLLETDRLLERLMKEKLLTLQDIDYDPLVHPVGRVEFSGHELPAYRGNLMMLSEDIRRWRQDKWRIVALVGDAKRASRLADTFLDMGVAAIAITEDREVRAGEMVIVPDALRQGYEDAIERLVLLGETDIYGAMRARRKVIRRNASRSMDLFADIQPGDYVVHESHGIGVFKGMKKITSEGATRDYMEIEYLKGDILYVPTEQLNRVEKYIGAEDRTPRVSRLGGTEWQGTKNKVKAKIQDMADELIKLYALREQSSGYAFSQDTPWQGEFEDRFEFEETPDQLRAIDDIKKDMESGRKMDRLLCGDVGYGKTEVAMRAAFKAVADGKQVAILVPTTVLAYQHFNTIQQRFQGFDIKFDMLSRFRSATQQKQILQGLKDGSVNIVVGTHRLLSSDVRFADLGLLIIDEEQRFGVSHKEKIKQLRNNVDVLVMTATPIPRTLHMSMSGIRDMSVIETPPEERQPVQTYVTEYDEQVIRDAILKELGRGGQVFYLYNRVESMPSFALQLSGLVPEARIAVAHGQLHSQQLEDLMLAFYHGEYDVLLCTTIIENGLDIPRANTLIVYDSDHFGLSQLYQLRGRVGRSSRQAYAYFTYRPEKVLSEIAEKRLSAIREFTEFGSGFKIAMRDLEIRGAGNLLGREQHGHMSSVGYALYSRLIEDAVKRLKGEQLVDVEEIDVRLDIQVDAHIPDSYIPEMMGRLEAYRRISTIETESERRDVLDELIDRYGDPPQAVVRLMDVAMLKSLAAQAQVELLQQKSERLFVIKFVQGADIDPLKLIDVVKSFRNRLILEAGDTPSLKFYMSEGGFKQLYDQAETLLKKLVLCKREAS